MSQFVALAVSVMIALGVAHTLGTGAATNIRIFMQPPPVDDQPAGVSGGGPVGSVGGYPSPTPPPKHGSP